MKEAKSIDYALLVLRVFAGLILLYYGCQKMLGVFGGKGFTETIAGFEKSMGLHPALAICAIFSEFFGSLGLILGFVTRIAAFGVAVTMFVAASRHMPDFSLNDAQAFKDVAYPLLIAGAATVLLISGPGKLALDSAFSRKKSKSS